MNIKKILTKIVLLLALCSTCASLSKPTVTKAETTVTAKPMFPKKMQGTWYTYSKYDKKLYKITITKKKIIYYGPNRNKSTLTVHKFIPRDNRPQTKKYLKKTAKWIFLLGYEKAHGRKWLHYFGWNQTAGAGDYFNVSKINGHKVLTTAAGAGVWKSEHYYRSAKLAKKLANRHYHHFQY